MLKEAIGMEQEGAQEEVQQPNPNRRGLELVSPPPRAYGIVQSSRFPLQALPLRTIGMIALRNVSVP